MKAVLLEVGEREVRAPGMGGVESSDAGGSSGGASGGAEGDAPEAAPLKARMAKRQIEVYYRNFFMMHHERAREMESIEMRARRGEFDEGTRVRLRREQFLRELEYVRRRRNPLSTAEYAIVKKIGHGSFGEVFLVRHKVDGTLFAMKKLQKKDMLVRRQVSHVWLERFVLASVGQHPHVVKMYYSFQDRHYLYFIMEYLPGGDLLSMLIRNDFLPENWARFYISQLIVAIDALHRTGIIHRDIKPDNVLFSAQGHVCLSDFGLSKSLFQPGEHHPDGAPSDAGASAVNGPQFIEHIRRGELDLPVAERMAAWKAVARDNVFSAVGTPNYIAPEVLQDRSYSESCDWWSVGAILYEMLVGYPPFWAKNPAHTCEMICQWRRYLQFPELPKSRCSKDARDLISRLLCEAPQRLGARRGLEEFKEHPFFEGVQWDKLNEAKAPFVPQLSSDTDTRYFDDDVTKQHLFHPTRGANCASKTNVEDPRRPPTETSRRAGPRRIGYSRRSARVLDYDRNMHAEFVGFTYIPVHPNREIPRGWNQDAYQPPSSAPAATATRLSSSVADALSLHIMDNVEGAPRPLLSPRGAAAEAAVAAATAMDELDMPPLPPHVPSVEDERTLAPEVSGSQAARVTAVPAAVRARIGVPVGSSIFDVPTTEQEQDSFRELRDVFGDVDVHDLEESLGAVQVAELPMGALEESADIVPEMDTGQEFVSPPVLSTNLHTSASSPELRTPRSDAGSTFTPDDALLSDAEPDSMVLRVDDRESSLPFDSADGPLNNTRVGRSLNKLSAQWKLPQEGGTLPDKPVTPPVVGLGAGRRERIRVPSTLEVDDAVMEIEYAAAELTKPQTSDVANLVRHATNEWRETVVDLKSTLASSPESPAEDGSLSRQGTASPVSL